MSKVIAVIDYGAGNLFSLKNALDFLKLKSINTKDKTEIEAADAIILPGVGAFADAMEKLERAGLVSLLRQQAKEKPFMGICLGMQLLFEQSEEFGVTQGLSLLPGNIVKLSGSGVKIPHMGWSDLRLKNKSPLTEGLKEGSFVYFVHSYAAQTPPQTVIADTYYGQDVPAIVGRDTVFGCQFHPEKSGEVGLRILENFGRIFE